jgi:hypothetical protein
MSRPHPVLRRAVSAGVVLVLMTGCAGARNTLGTSASACYRGLPDAKQAVSNKGRIVGVKKFPVATLEKHVPNDPDLLKLPAKESLCVFAFRGKYQSGDVPLATIRSGRSFAIVAVTLKRPHVVAAYVLDHLPTHFRHTRA